MTFPTPPRSCPPPPDARAPRLRLALFSPSGAEPSETFVRAHIERLPFEVVPVHGTDWALTDAAGRPLWPRHRLIEAIARRTLPESGRGLLARMTAAYLRSIRADAVLAEFGPTGVRVRQACALAGVPLFVHFHGYDASIRRVLAEHERGYREMFAQAEGIVAVSRPMLEALAALGAPATRLVLSPCGVDPDRFAGADPARAAPLFLAVGRFVEKKAPYLTVLAFRAVAQALPEARLAIVGTGPLLGPTRRLAAALGLDGRVDFLGVQPPERVGELMRSARAFVQHSLAAEDGDSEGTPVAVVEAQMSGLPVVSTLHAGIPEVVLDGRTGFLVPEGDAEAMGRRMLELARDPALAARLGRAGRERAIERFTMQRHLDELADMIRHGVQRRRAATGAVVAPAGAARADASTGP